MFVCVNRNDKLKDLMIKMTESNDHPTQIQT